LVGSQRSVRQAPKVVRSLDLERRWCLVVVAIIMFVASAFGVVAAVQ